MAHYTPQKHQQYLLDLVAKTQPWHKFFPTEFENLRLRQKSFDSKLVRFSKEESTLNIAIMGQVKAGKSSFLNALLFDGKPILPEAATPKTANLTRISYADKPKLEVDFFNQSDWELIRNLASTEGDSHDIKMAKEQVQMVVAMGIDPMVIINQGTYKQETNSLEDIMLVLNDYAGNDGKYTALVKMIRLYLPLQELQGYNIIDTPGMNDPVISRTQRTKEEMANSDVVFFLSRASNFLDAADTNLITSQLPEAGVKRLILVAGQYDSAIDQDGYDRNSLVETEINLQQRIVKRAEVELVKIIENKRKMGQDVVADILAKIGEPILSSTYAYGYANWPRESWGKGMLHSYEGLLEIAKHQWNYQFSKDDWLRIGGFDKLKGAYEQARQDKVNIVEMQKMGLLPDAIDSLNIWKAGLQKQLNQRIYELTTSTIDSLNKKQTDYESKIDKVTDVLSGVFDVTITNAIKNKNKINAQLSSKKDEKGNIRIYTGTETYEQSYTVESTAKRWGRKLTFGLYDGREYRTRTVTEEYQYAQVSDAVERLTSYTRWAKNDIEKIFDNVVNPKAVRSELKEQLSEVLNTSDKNFDVAHFRAIIEQSIERIELPYLSLDIGNVGEMISSHFSGRTTRDTYGLQSQLGYALESVHDSLYNEFNVQIDNLIDGLKAIKTNLTKELTKNIQAELNQLRQDLVEKETMVASYQELGQMLS